jgi:outer membrane protein OmpA-like peptidoglycan-associated protein
MFFVSETKSKKKAIINEHVEIWNRDIKPIDCKNESTLRSVEGTQKTNIFIMNRAGVTLKVYWLNYEGKRIFFNSLGTGQAYLQETQMNHYWILTDELGNCFGIFSSQTSEVSNVYVEKIPKIESDLPFLSGTITDRHNDKGLNSDIFIVSKNNKDTIKTTSNSYGEFSVPLAEGKYQFLIRKNGYLNYSEQIIITPESNEFTFSMIPKELSTSYILHNVTFFQSTSKLLPQSDTALNKLHQFLVANKNTHIRLEGHTDNQDANSLNKELSEDRALTIKRYLVERGIDEKRIATIGYGGTKPIASNLKEETRKLNRRVEFRVIK